MNMKYALSCILLYFSLFSLPSCNDSETSSNAPGGEEIENTTKSYDWQLEGKWKYASGNDSDFSQTLIFEKTAKGLMMTVHWNGTVPTINCTLILTTANP